MRHHETEEQALDKAKQLIERLPGGWEPGCYELPGRGWVVKISHGNVSIYEQRITGGYAVMQDGAGVMDQGHGFTPEKALEDHIKVLGRKTETYGDLKAAAIRALEGE